MNITWTATKITFFPVLIKSENGTILGEFKNPLNLTYKKQDYNFQYSKKTLTGAISRPSEYKVFTGANNLVADISDPQWLKPIKICLKNGKEFTIKHKFSFAEQFTINEGSKKIGQFEEKFFAWLPCGILEMDDKYINDELIAIVLYIGLYRKMLTN